MQTDVSNWRQILLDFCGKTRKPLIVILGPTASGKTDFSIDVAYFLAQDCGTDAEIVNADSRQLYRGLSIGTAKITEEEQHGIPHHLLDVLDPDEEATAGWYQQQAYDCIAQIQQAGHIPLLVGGSMLYVSAVIDGLTMAPVPDEVLRQRLMEEYDKDNGATLFKRLQMIDPESAEKIHPHNKPRLVRAVEIFELTGKSKSKTVPTSQLICGEKAEQNLCTKSKHDLLVLGVQLPRTVLCERINKRTHQMFASDWIEEVRLLLEQGYTTDDPGMKSHGYREIIHFLKNEEPPTEEELQELIATKTRQYARRQMTWWKHDPRIHWITLLA